MEDPKNDPKKSEIGSTQDFEMGEEETEKPKINKYSGSSTSGNNPEQTTDIKKIDPKAQAPEPSPDYSNQSKNLQWAKDQAKSSANISEKNIKPVDTAKRKKAILGCLGGFGAIVLIFLVLSFVFIGQSGEDNPIAKLLGINAASFTNGLITLVHIVFILVALSAFVFTMIGLFRASMAKKDDKMARKAGMKTSLIAGISLILILIVWMFVYLYLDTKRVQTEDAPKTGIITEPEETLGLTAPIEIRFDASNLPINSKKFQIISYKWDFGDGETGTNQIVSHIYKDKGTNDGVFDVLLTVTMRDKDTSEELKGEYAVKISIANEALTAIFEADPQSGPAPLEVEFDASASSDPDGTISSYEWDLDEDGEYDDATGPKIKHEFEKVGKYTVGLRVVSTTNEYETTEKEIVVEEESLPEAVIEVADEPEYFSTNVEYIFKAGESSSPNGEIEQYEWDFGDGSQIQKNRTVAHTFETEGTFEILLKVTDEKGEEGEATLSITVGAPKGTPKAVISTTPSSGDDSSLEGSVPFQVVFDASGSTDSDDNIVDYEWDFENDGNVDTAGKTVNYSYNEEGTYTVKLMVTDADGNIGTDTVIIKVSAQGIIAILDANKVEGSAPLTVKFDASGSTYEDGQITSYKWDFGDGTKEKFGPAEITHRYDSIGTYTASVTIIGADNVQSTSSILITVREVALSACFSSVFTSGKAPLATTFDPSCSSGTIIGYFWDFGDGETSTSIKPNHTYSDPGTYTVTLEISDSDNTVDSSSQTITVTE